MKSFIIDEKNEGQRLDKYLRRILKNASSGFIYKMLRKKNIKLNSQKARGNEILVKSDEIDIFFSDETMLLLSGTKETKDLISKKPDGTDNSIEGFGSVREMIIYEDSNILIVNKPCGLLSQSDRPGGISLNELCLKYLIDKGELSSGELNRFRPSICNRLDRNTSGLIIFAKNYRSANLLSEGIRDKTIKKYYLALVKGNFKGEQRVRSYLVKDEASNTVMLFNEKKKDSSLIETCFKAEGCYGNSTLVKALLKTGKTHQIRAQLSALGYPVLGDPKYGDKELNRLFRKQTGLKRQLLHSSELIMPVFSGLLEDISQKKFEAPLPQDFITVMDYIKNGL